MSRTKPVSFAQLCAVAKQLLLAADTIESVEWKERIKERVFWLGYQTPTNERCNQAMDAIERANPWLKARLDPVPMRPGPTRVTPSPVPPPVVVDDLAPAIQVLVRPVFQLVSSRQLNAPTRSRGFESSESACSPETRTAMKAALDEYWEQEKHLAVTRPMCEHCRRSIVGTVARCSHCHSPVHADCAR